MNLKHSQNFGQLFLPIFRPIKDEEAKATANAKLEALWLIIQRWALSPGLLVILNFPDSSLMLLAKLPSLCSILRRLTPSTALLLALGTAPMRLACLWHTTSLPGSLATDNPPPLQPHPQKFGILKKRKHPLLEIDPHEIDPRARVLNYCFQ